MKTFCALLGALVFGFLAGEAGAAQSRSPWEHSVVTLEVTRKQYDYLQPWTKRVAHVQKTGTVIGPREILTTADSMADQTMIRLQKGGRGKWWPGELRWIDYHANLAVVSAAEAAFWKDLRPVPLAASVPGKGSVQLIRWRNGNLEIRKTEINRLIVKGGKLSFLEHLHLEIDSEINGTGWAEAIVSGSKLIGMVSSKEEHGCTVLPSSFIRSCLEARKTEPYRGLGYFDFVWQRAENPATLKHLKLVGEPRGVIVIDSRAKPSQAQVLKRHDIILQIDGFDIDTQGDYKDPAHGNLLLENLATRNKRAGDKIHIKIWRDGAGQGVLYELPPVEYSVDLVPEAVFDQEPEYLLMGGLLFQPLTEPYLQSWGNDWRRKAPFRLSYYKLEKPAPEKPSLVVLSLVLPDAHNLGYQDSRYLVVNKLNGRRVTRLADLLEAIKHPVEGFHILEFRDGDSMQRMVLDAGETEAATRRVLQRYGIEKDHVIASPPLVLKAGVASNGNERPAAW